MCFALKKSPRKKLPVWPMCPRMCAGSRYFAFFLGIISITAFFSSMRGVSSGAELSTAIVVASEIKPYLQAMEGIRSSFASSPYIYHMESNPKLVAKRIGEAQHDVVFAVGPEAASIVWSHASDSTRKIVLMVLDPIRITNVQVCGVDMRVPMAQQLAAIEKNLGKGRVIGILYSPSENEAVIKEAMEAVQTLDVQVVGLPVCSSSDAVSVLRKARVQIDTLLFIPDSQVIVSETVVAYLVKEAFLSGLFVVGYNQFFLEAGASLAFCLDYYKTGQVAAELARETASSKSCKLAAPPYEVRRNQKAIELIQRGVQ